MLKTWILANKGPIGLFLLSVVLLVPALNFGLWEPWEPKYARAAVEMMERGDYLTPYYRGEPRLSKPPLTYLAIIASYTVLGVSEFSTRLPFVAWGIAAVMVFGHAVSRLYGRRTGLLAGLVLLTCPMFHLLMRQAMPDALFVANLTIALSFLALALFEDAVRGRHVALGAVFTGLAFLSKGPIALLVVGPILAVYVAITIDWAAGPAGTLRSLGRVLFRTLRIHWSVPLVLAIGLPWYVHQVLTHDAMIERLKFDYLERFTDPEGGHDGTIGFYFDALVYGVFPWCALVPVALLCMVLGPKRTWTPPDSTHLYFLCWLVCPFLMFSAAETKFSYYVAPALPALALLAAIFLDAYLGDRERPAKFMGLSILAVGLYLLPAKVLVDDAKYLLGSITIKREILKPIRADDTLADPTGTFTVLFALFGVALLATAALSFADRGRKLAVGAMAAVAIALAAWNALYIVPLLEPHKSFKQMMATAEAAMDEGDRIGIYYPGRNPQQAAEPSAIEASTIFYSGDEIIEMIRADHLERFLVEGGGTHLIVKRDKFRDVARILREHDLQSKLIDDTHYRFVLIEVTPADQ